MLGIFITMEYQSYSSQGLLMIEENAYIVTLSEKIRYKLV